MSSAIIIAIVSIAVGLLINIGGWVWFFATLTARVEANENRLAIVEKKQEELPKSFVPRDELVALLQGMSSKLELLVTLHHGKKD